MNAVVHSRISVSRRGGQLEDYLPIHELMDSTKELCSDNRHRILHTLWGIKRVIVPIIGHSISNSEGKVINTKDLCEQDHVLPDYQNRFIPTLADFVQALDLESVNHFDFEEILAAYQDQPAVYDLLTSPLSNTGIKASLLITCNSWFLNDILPRIFDLKKEIKNYEIKPADFFDNLHFKLWMDNGSHYPPSARFTTGKIVG